jgi:Protein of unknown function (DUF3606)
MGRRRAAEAGYLRLYLGGIGTGEQRVANNKFPRAVAPDNDRINIHDAGEMRVWIKAFGISREKLEAAVLAAGTDAVKVRLHLSKQT